MAHDGANRNDHKLLKPTLDSIPIDRPKPTREAPQGLCLDKAYDNTESNELVVDYQFTPHIRARGEEIADKLHVPGLARPTLGRGSDPLLAQPQPRDPDPLVEERPQPPRSPPTRQRPHRVQESPERDTCHPPSGIGPKGLYEVLARLPGVTLEGRVTDGLGRSGLAVSIAGGPTRAVLVVDPVTGGLLATEEIAPGNAKVTSRFVALDPTTGKVLVAADSEPSNILYAETLAATGVVASTEARP